MEEHEADWRHIRYNLRILMALRAGAKLSCGAKGELVLQEGLGTSVARTWAGDTRQRSLELAEGVVRDGVRLTEIPSDEHEDLLEELQGALRGLCTMRATYAADVHFLARLEVALSSLQALFRSRGLEVPLELQGGDAAPAADAAAPAADAAAPTAVPDAAAPAVASDVVAAAAEDEPEERPPGGGGSRRYWGRARPWD